MSGQRTLTILFDFAFQRLASFTTVPDPLRFPTVALVLAEDTLGANVQIVRDLIGEHVEEAFARESSVETFLAGRFAGAAPTNGG